MRATATKIREPKRVRFSEKRWRVTKLMPTRAVPPNANCREKDLTSLFLTPTQFVLISRNMNKSKVEEEHCNEGRSTSRQGSGNAKFIGSSWLWIVYRHCLSFVPHRLLCLRFCGFTARDDKHASQKGRKRCTAILYLSTLYNFPPSFILHFLPLYFPITWGLQWFRGKRQN